MKTLGIDRATIEYMLLKAPIILKDGLDIKHARLYAEKIQWAGGRVKMKESGFFESNNASPEPYVKGFGDFTICPQCGYKQDRHERCIRCGFLLESNG